MSSSDSANVPDLMTADIQSADTAFAAAEDTSAQTDGPEDDAGSLDEFLGLPAGPSSEKFVSGTDTSRGKGPLWRKIQRASGLMSPVRLLAELATEPHLNTGLLRRLRGGAQVVMVVTVPSPSWVEPISSVLAGQAGHRAKRIDRLTRPKMTSTSKPDDDITGLLFDGRSIVAVTPEPAWISPILLGAADHHITIAPLDAALVSRAIAI